MTKYQIVSHSAPDTIFCREANTTTCEVGIHLHDCYEIFMALSDNIQYFVEDRVYKLAKYDVIITNNYELHYPQIIDTQPYQRIFIQFFPQYFSNILDVNYNPLRIFTNRSNDKCHKIATPEHGNQKLLHYFTEIQQLSSINNAKSNILIYSYMLQLLVELDDLYQQHQSTPIDAHEIDKRVQKMILMIEENYTKNISLESLCSSLFVDKHYMSHLFKSSTGFTVNAFIQSKRIQYAKKMILKGHTMIETSYACGFSEYSNFYKTFKKLVKMSPRDYSLLYK